MEALSTPNQQAHQPRGHAEALLITGRSLVNIAREVRRRCDDGKAKLSNLSFYSGTALIE
jgi:hypothetical protein